MDFAPKVIEFLLQIKAIKLQPNEPFTWASGIQSPIYCDNRKILSYPKVRNYIRQCLVKALNENYGSPDVIAGVATGGIALGVLLAQEMGLPFVYVRPEAKSHGLNNQIEGVLEQGQSVIIVEDLISTGGSSLKAVEAIRANKCIVKGMLAIFTYEMASAKANFNLAKCPLITLASYSDLIKKAEEINYISAADVAHLNNWKKDPINWLK